MTANIPTANTVTDNDQTASPESTEYLAHLQRFSANSGNVVITANVVNAQGVLLVAKGERLTESHTQKIIRHKLARPIEECVGLEPMLHPKSLKQRIDELLAQRPDVAECIQVSKASIGLMPCLVFVNTFPIVIQKLTVLEASMVHVYEQALINALLCLCVGNVLEYDKATTAKLFLIALCENISYLHLHQELGKAANPPAHLLKEYFVHPIVGQTMFEAVGNIPASVLGGIGAHHERVDGTGFPRMLRGKQIPTAVHITGIVDEWTKSMLFKDSNGPNNLLDAARILQFKRAHFTEHIFNTVMRLAGKLTKTPSRVSVPTDLKALAQRELDKYCDCLIFCDVIARLSDAAALDLQNPSVYRIGALSSGLIKSIFASGMLANVTCQIINNMLREPDEALLPEIVEIGYCHTSVLEQAEHILQILDYMLTDQHWLDQDSKARSSLQACHLFASHLNTTRNNTQVWAVLRNEVLENEKDLATIIATLRA